MISLQIVDIPSTRACGLRELRERNRLRVIEALRKGPPLTQAAISRDTGLSRTTISSLVMELKGRGIIETMMSHPAGTRSGNSRSWLKLTLDASAAVQVPPPAALLCSDIQLMAEENKALAAENVRLKSVLASIADLAKQS
jgi:DNA-binding transcriptional regulator LsrR (DeoR family)